MKSLIITCAFELKDKRCLALIEQYPDIDIFRNIHGVVSESWLVDRTATVKLPFHTTVLEENILPDFTTIPQRTLYDTCMFRATELITNCKKIYFLWSGGIDSTMALTSFIMAGVSKEQLIVVCNSESIKENPQFYKNHILGKFDLMASELMMQRMKLSNIDGTILSCEQGDLLYGQDFGFSMFELLGSDFLNASVSKENAIKFFVANNMNENSASCWYDIFMTSAKNSPRSINNMYDFSWWCGFNWRWQWAVEKIKIRTAQSLDIQTFFSSNEMQAWSVLHNQRQVVNKADFKYEFKKLIYDYTKDITYFDKIKHPSATFYYTADSYAAIDSNYKRYKSKDFSIIDYYQPDNFISQWLAC